MFKISATPPLSSSVLEKNTYSNALISAIDVIEVAMLKNNISESSSLGGALIEALKLITTAKSALIIPDTLRSRTSSNTSTGSLGDRIAIHDKETFLYTYKWTSRNSDVNS